MYFRCPIVVSELVTMGSIEHLFPITFAIGFGVFLIWNAKKKLSTRQQFTVFHVLGCFVSATVLTFHIYKIALGNYNFNTDLPLFLCSFLAVIVPVYTYYRKYWMYEIIVFWIIAGTLQGVITPDIPIGYPSFDFFRYWIVHLGLIMIILYATLVFGIRPKLKSVFKSVLALNGYAAVTLFLNWILGANYSYLSSKPEVASALDFFHEWPFYILELELIIIPYFLFIYLGFYVFRNKIEKA